MRFLVSLGIVIASVVPAAAQNPPVQGLVQDLVAGPPGGPFTTAFIRLRESLQSKDATAAGDARSALCQALSTSARPMAIRCIGRVLAAAPSDQVLSIASSLLDPTRAADIQEAACDVVAELVPRYTPQDRQLVQATLDRLAAVVQDRSAPGRLVNEAVQAIAAFGPQGLDLLLKLRHEAPAALQASQTLYCFALARTRDPRALPFLRDVLTDPMIHGGLQRQAAHALGWLASALGSRGLPIDPAERQKCIQVLTRIVATAEDDQLHSVALQSLSKLDTLGGNAELNRQTFDDLYSPSSIRREGALQTLYAARVTIAGASLDRVRSIAQSDEDGTCRATARAVIDELDSATQPSP